MSGKSQTVERSSRLANQPGSALDQADGLDDSTRLAAFVRFNPNPVMELDDHAGLTYCNAAARRLAADLNCASPAQLLPSGTLELIGHCLEYPSSQPRVQSGIGARTLEWSFFPIPGARIVYCHAADLTERVSIEAQLRRAQKLEAVGQLAAGIAHDFNNILTVIEGHAALLMASHQGPSPCQRPLREITDAADRAGKLVRQLLMFCRKQVLHPKTVDLGAVVSSMVPMLERTLGEHIRVQFAAHQAVPLTPADPGMVEQILVSLAVNARDAMPQGGLFVVATREVDILPEVARENAEARPGKFVVLSVSDTGCGIPAQNLRHIFEPFFTTKEVGKGTGLGLASVFGGIKQHNGWIEVRSEVGRGTSFNLYFPVVEPLPPTHPPTASSVARRSTLRGNETVLVVEDEPALRRLVVEILEWHGYRVFSAESGVLALEVWREEREGIDLLVTDMVMPGLMGPELAERLQRESPKLRVIYTSGYSPGIAGKDLALLEGSNFLPKPYPPSRLLQLVRECLDARG